MRHAKIRERNAQCAADFARRDPPFRNDGVEIESAEISSKTFRSARVDRLDADRLRPRQRRADIVGDLRPACACAHKLEQYRFIAEHDERRAINVGDHFEFSVGQNRIDRRHRRLDDEREPHRRIEAPGRVLIRRRRTNRAALVSVAEKDARARQQGPGDMGVNVDRASGHDTARRIDRLHRVIARRFTNNSSVDDEKVANRISPIRGIDDAAALDTQRRHRALRETRSATFSRT